MRQADLHAAQHGGNASAVGCAQRGRDAFQADDLLYPVKVSVLLPAVHICPLARSA